MSWGIGAEEETEFAETIMDTNKLTRRAAIFDEAALVGATAFAKEESSGGNLGTTALAFGKPIEIDLRSTPMTWRDSPVHLLRFHSVRFALDEAAGALVAELKGATISFDNVDDEVSGAMLDEEGALLGAGRAVCKVPRDWLGLTSMSLRDLKLDFGTSLDYVTAQSFQLSISRRKVLTPDQWAKGD